MEVDLITLSNSELLLLAWLLACAETDSRVLAGRIDRRQRRAARVEDGYVLSTPFASPLFFSCPFDYGHPFFHALLLPLFAPFLLCCRAQNRSPFFPLPPMPLVARAR